ncbi:MAG TPA: hypothetical protein P5186_08265 [Candidatus Paceibacterota bacterium]|nr:hypothetical protein [Verrucomicrobiota bacterium]HRY48025.1 hypothetical protein [Candidatus Paceibacterota bacterium]
MRGAMASAPVFLLSGCTGDGKIADAQTPPDTTPPRVVRKPLAQGRSRGQRYNLADPVDLGKFQEAGPTAKCGGVVRKAVRIAAGLILHKG